MPHNDRHTNRQTNRHTDEIIYVRFCRYVCISFANFFLRKKYIAQLSKISPCHFLENNRRYFSFKSHGPCIWLHPEQNTSRVFPRYVLIICDRLFKDSAGYLSRVSKADEVPICSHIWFASTTFKQL